MLLQLLEGHPPTRTSLIAMLMMLITMTTKVIGKPQVSMGALPMAGKMGTSGFAKENLAASMDGGAAVSYEKERRKRSALVPSIDETLWGEETMLALPLYHQHLHRDKRAPCYYGGGGAGGGSGSGGADGGGDGGTADDIARRRRANARKRLAAAKKKAETRKKAKKFTTDDDNVEEPLSRRKRQSEVDDLNENTENNVSKDFSQHVQQVAEKLEAIWQEFKQSMNNMAERIKQHFNDKNSTNTTEV